VLVWYQNLKITIKLRLAFALLAAIAAAVGLGGLFTMSMLKWRVEAAYQQDLPAVSAIKEAGISQLKAMRVLLRVVLAAGDNDEIGKQNAELNQALESERKQLLLCNSKLRSAEGKAELLAAEKLLPTFEKGASDIVVAAKAGDVVGFRSAILDLVPISDKIQHSFDLISQITEKQAAQSESIASATYWGALTLMAPTVVVSGLLAISMSFLMSAIIAAPLARMVKVLESVAQGDLTQNLPVKSTDETGQVARSLNRALASLRRTLSEVSASSREVESASRGLAATASSLAAGSATQAASVEASTSGLEQMSATIRSNSDSTNRASEFGVAAREAAEKGDESVLSAITAMDEIRKSSDAISRVAEAINDLAFQSNLLAVNASIEAARAGESGRSFAVVGEEMRHLAERSKASAKEIGHLIANSLERVKNGTQLVNSSGEALSVILDSVRTLAGIVDQIAVSSKQQSAGVDHITDAMTRVDLVVKETSSKTQTLSSTAQQLANLAGDLNETLTHFSFEGAASEVEDMEGDDFTTSIDAMKSWFTSRFQRA
jgi:methyl-accepting chemotaxis protein